MKQKIHYNIDELDKKGALINIIIGERSNGKSYQIKHKKGIYKYLFNTKSYHADYDSNKIIEESIKQGSRFMLVRRLDTETKPSIIESYFMDIDVFTLTEGKYNCFKVYQNKIWLAKYDLERGKTLRGEYIGYVVALSLEQNFAGGSFLDVTDIIFEEFITRTIYLKNEPSKLMNLFSTVDRKKGTTRMWLAGNSISQVCPYYTEWGLSSIMQEMKQGDIREKWLNASDDGKIKVKIAIEYCKSTGRSSFVIGRHRKMLNDGSWQTDPQPKLPKSINDYQKLFQIGFQYKDFKFIGLYILDPKTKDTVWFIYPTKKEFKDNMIVFSDIIKPSIYWQRDIYLPAIRNEKIIRILQTFKENQIFYASDLCGTDFKQVIDFTIRK